MDLVAIEKTKSRIAPTGSPKRNRDVQEKDFANYRYPTGRCIFAGLPDRDRWDKFYDDFMASFGECSRNDGKVCRHVFPSFYTYGFKNGMAVLEIYKVRLRIQNAEEAKIKYRAEVSKPSLLYGVISVGSSYTKPGEKSGGDFLYKVGRDESSANMEFSGDMFEIPLNLKQPYPLLSDTTISVALKLNGVDLIGCDQEEDEELMSPPYDFEGEKITCGRLDFFTTATWELVDSSVLYKLVRRTHFDATRKDGKGVVCPNPIAVYVDYGVLVALTAKVTSVTILDPSVAAVSGQISASFCSLNPEVEVLLFKGSQRELEPVTHTVALSRSFVAVPYTSYLLLQVQLHDQHGKLIVSGTFAFPPITKSNFVSKTENISICVEFLHRPPDAY
ncbi:unnamed protein product [Cuscuta epithymum]|uniref:Uncharacterized protein n=1 Tax=Cuscuta epithymum TaxID=186058 RepID=A0AAV0C7U1_9ASTE|nr:unnamed protein product [Cuscuta epithymum]